MFGCFIGTTPLSGSSPACLWAVRLWPSPTALPLLLTDAGEVSRFSRGEFPDVPRFFGRAGAGRRWR